MQNLVAVEDRHGRGTELLPLENGHALLYTLCLSYMQ